MDGTQDAAPTGERSGGVWRGQVDKTPILLVVLGLVLFVPPSLLRHHSFLSSAYDLGIFDQAVFLISKGQQPVSSFLGFHILGDHASLVLYPLAAFYLVWSSAAALLVIQAAALALGVWPTWALAVRAGHTRREALFVSAAYLSSPILFNANLFDFHPEAIAIPSLLWAALAARERRPLAFGLAIATTLACKAALGLTVAALGAWLWLRERRRAFGLSALAAGVGWLLVAATVVIPAFSGGPPAALARYASLGGSLRQVLASPLSRPAVVVSRVLSRETCTYIAKCALPVGWAVGGGSVSASDESPRSRARSRSERRCGRRPPHRRRDGGYPGCRAHVRRDSTTSLPSPQG
jgi:uncharacterized membrane protein